MCCNNVHRKNIYTRIFITFAKRAAFASREPVLFYMACISSPFHKHPMRVLIGPRIQNSNPDPRRLVPEKTSLAPMLYSLRSHQIRASRLPERLERLGTQESNVLSAIGTRTCRWNTFYWGIK